MPLHEVSPRNVQYVPYWQSTYYTGLPRDAAAQDRDWAYEAEEELLERYCKFFDSLPPQQMCRYHHEVQGNHLVSRLEVIAHYE